jgi:hypothetical protein
MLRATPEEREHVVDYVSRQTRGETVTLAQKVYREQLSGETHAIWDVHTNKSRWWVITNPLMNLYAQDQFPNMDLALTFHIGLCVRIPRSERTNADDFPAGPVIAAWRKLDEAKLALAEAEEISDFQAIGMKCRESLIALVDVAQDLVEPPRDVERPKRADVRAWSEIIANQIFSGAHHAERRRLAKVFLVEAWTFSNWLTHAREAHVLDADSAAGATELALGLLTTALIRHVRGVPDRCPVCGSQRLSPEQGFHTRDPKRLYERPVCEKCRWTGTPVEIQPPPALKRPRAPKGECVTMEIPLIRFPGSATAISASESTLKPGTRAGTKGKNLARHRTRKHSSRQT